MKQFVCLFNCHGNEVVKQLQQNDQFKKIIVFILLAFILILKNHILTII